MKQEVSDFSSMQDDCRQWDYEYLTWRADIERWRREHESAMSGLAMLHELVRQQGEALESHFETLEQRQQSLRDHDRAVSEYQVLGDKQLEKQLAEKHREQVERHQHQQVAHTRIQQHHDNVMAHLKMLKEAIESGM